MTLYFVCRINKDALLQTNIFGDFAHWANLTLRVQDIHKR